MLNNKDYKQNSLERMYKEMRTPTKDDYSYSPPQKGSPRINNDSYNMFQSLKIQKPSDSGRAYGDKKHPTVNPVNHSL